ncbi:MAG: hypothetical protein UZ21_OP11001000642 [Microgenomates bacterium OLB22]|nr:MAG: hypothetical protein UZ21_OP11001000642 [Microgenomates bacterium OLB22]
MPSLSGLFAGINKYLFILLILFLCMIGLLWRQRMLMTKQHSTRDTSPPSRLVPRVSLTPIKQLIEKSARDYPMNRIMYESVKSQLLQGEKLTSTGRTTGKVLKREVSTESTALLIESSLPNMRGSQIWFVYGPETISKITVVSEKDPGGAYTTADIDVGDQVYIDEKNDYSLNYPQSIQSVKITLL